ncbi:F-box/kelch-repeat protein-like protein [Tanacetum coccineum]
MDCEYKTLSKSNCHQECNNIGFFCSFGLYYNFYEDDYRLLYVRNLENKVYIYSLRSDSWRKVDVFQDTSRLYLKYQSPGTYLNDNLYFLQDSDEPLSSIIRFDTKTERFSKIETPNADDNLKVYDYCASITVKGDCIHVCVKYDTGLKTFIKLWKLDKDGKMTEVLNYQLRLHDFIDFDIIRNLIPFHLLKNGKWLMLKNRWSSYNHRIYKVDLKKKMHITNKGKQKDFEYANVGVGDAYINNIKLIDKEVRYIETFVSPNRYMK